MSRIEEVKWALYNWLVAYSDIDAEKIQAGHQNSTDPNAEGIVIIPWLSDEDEAEFPDRVWNQEQLAMVFHRAINSQLHVYGPRAVEVSHRLRRSLSRNDVYSMFWEPDPGGKHTGCMAACIDDLNYLPEQIGVSYRDHVAIDMTVCLAEVEIEDLATIDAAEIQILPEGEPTITIDLPEGG